LKEPGGSTAGTYDLLNALIQSNGDLRVIVDQATRVVPAAEPGLFRREPAIW
jgi:hypothetical protein